MTTDTALSRLLQNLVTRGRVAVDDWPDGLEAPELYGLERAGAELCLPAETELLAEPLIRDELSPDARAWLRDLELDVCIASTNDRLMTRAQATSIAGMVCLAELQTSGRGRRGRSWFSPFARNLALSAGFAVDRPLPELGGLSLMVGLAVIDALRDFGVAGAGLKWPNDILLGPGKLGGILIELIGRPRAAEAVVGVGLNVALPAAVRGAVPQAVVDLAGAGHPVSRSRLAGRLVSHLVRYVKLFEESGFGPLRDRYQREHAYHRRECRLSGSSREVVGLVVGVTETGELLLETPSGVEAFGAGEVSLRSG